MADELDATTLLEAATSGSREASERLFALVYDDLRARAANLLRKERSDHTLQPTALVHEAFLRLIDRNRCAFRNQNHFLAVASRAMRRVLVDHARRRGAQRRGGGIRHLPLDDLSELSGPDRDATLIALDRALERLAGKHPDFARVVELRFFGGMTIEECGEILGVSPRTVSRQWEFAQAWLFRELARDDPPSDGR